MTDVQKQIIAILRQYGVSDVDGLYEELVKYVDGVESDAYQEGRGL